MNLEPLRDNVVVKRSVAETHSPGGIVLPDNAQEAPTEGVILAVGPLVNASLVVGERVIFGQHSGTVVKVDDGEEVLVLEEDHLLAIVREDGNHG